MGLQQLPCLTASSPSWLALESMLLRNSRRVTGSPVREAVLGRPVLHGIQASCLSAPQVIGCRLVGS